jgi:hypothetical protein
VSRSTHALIGLQKAPSGPSAGWRRCARWIGHIVAQDPSPGDLVASGRIDAVSFGKVEPDKDLSVGLMATVSARQLFGAVLLGVCLGGFGGVMRRLFVMSAGGMRVMRGFFVKAGIVMLRRLLVMARRVFVVLRRFPMMLCRFFRHQASFVSGSPQPVITVRHDLIGSVTAR